MYQRFVKLSEINETAKHEATKINWELTSNTKKIQSKNSHVSSTCDFFVCSMRIRSLFISVYKYFRLSRCVFSLAIVVVVVSFTAYYSMALRFVSFVAYGTSKRRILFIFFGFICQICEISCENAKREEKRQQLEMYAWHLFVFVCTISS